MYVVSGAWKQPKMTRESFLENQRLKLLNQKNQNEIEEENSDQDQEDEDDQNNSENQQESFLSRYAARLDNSWKKELFEDLGESSSESEQDKFEEFSLDVGIEFKKENDLEKISRFSSQIQKRKNSHQNQNQKQILNYKNDNSNNSSPNISRIPRLKTKFQNIKSGNQIPIVFSSKKI
ncbi:hypothetical protein M0811_05151 [Anaeramoeba ignava]|uniref:Uncharacterized protein n=1 Tax=Anaeramoeba ignava TaxID=1746090 RepID=A0A9Q0LSU5_ANAIG|nr:hypothetical protein M0811_05151 [Anaeramoeba ignava]